MKKVLTVVVILAALLAGGWFAVEKVFRGGDVYYTQITTNGKYEENKTDSGEIVADYSYNQPGYNANGEKVQLEFNGNKPRPLKRNAYLAVVLKNETVRSWKQVAKADVPKKALAKLRK